MSTRTVIGLVVTKDSTLDGVEVKASGSRGVVGVVVEAGTHVSMRGMKISVKSGPGVPEEISVKAKANKRKAPDAGDGVAAKAPKHDEKSDAATESAKEDVKEDVKEPSGPASAAMPLVSVPANPAGAAASASASTSVPENPASASASASASAMADVKANPKRERYIFPRAVVKFHEPTTAAYQKLHKKLRKLAHREVEGLAVREYRHSVPTIAEVDRQGPSRFSCFVCELPITERLARKPCSIPVSDDSQPFRRQDANGEYYDVSVPTGFWIICDGVPYSFDPAHAHHRCFRSMRDDNFDLFLGGGD